MSGKRMMIMRTGDEKLYGCGIFSETQSCKVFLFSDSAFSYSARLQRYSYTFAQEAHLTGMPVVRPLFLVYPEEKEAWKDWQTFLYGPDILVSAIWRKNVRSHSLYLPGGGEWVDAWNPEKIYRGGQKISVGVDLPKIPLFIRKNSKINLGNLQALFEESLQLAANKPNLEKLQRGIH